LVCSVIDFFKGLIGYILLKLISIRFIVLLIAKPDAKPWED